MTDPGEDIFLPPPRRWGPGGWAVAACAVLVAAGGAVALLAYDRRLFLLACAVGTSHYLAYKLPNRNLLAELANRDARLDAYDLSAKRTDLDVVGPAVTPPGGTRVDQLADLKARWRDRHDSGAPIEVEPFMADSGYRPPRSATGANGVGSAHFIDPDPLACVYDRTDTAKVERIAGQAADCGCPECWAWLIRNGYLDQPDPDVSEVRSLPKGRWH